MGWRNQFWFVDLDKRKMLHRMMVFVMTSSPSSAYASEKGERDIYHTADDVTFILRIKISITVFTNLWEVGNKKVS